MTSIDNAVSYMSAKTWNVSRLGLERIERLMDAIGNPQRKLKYVHVAGTNGKGSVCSYISYVLREAGYKTGLFTSPYIHRFEERIQINGVPINDDDFSKITEFIRVKADEMNDHPTEFEMMTAVAFEYFYRQKCDIVVLEVGLGGRLDSTNIIEKPEVAVVTSIGLDHIKILGDTVEKIAYEKGGIIKNDCTFVLYPQCESVNQVLLDICTQKNAKPIIVKAENIRPVSHDLDGQVFCFGEMKNLRTSLLGAHQLRNAATAITTLEVLKTKGFIISDAAMRRGIENTRWLGRFEILSKDPLFIVDGGHNAECAKTVTKNIEDYLDGQKVIFLMGMLADKDYKTVIDIVIPYAKRFVTVTPNSTRALCAQSLADTILQCGGMAETEDSVSVGIKKALEYASRDHETVVAFGSLYMTGEIREYFDKFD